MPQQISYLSLFIVKMFARQAQIAILSLLLSTFLSAQISSTDGSCRDFTHGGCQMDQLFETVKDINESICQVLFSNNESNLKS